MVGNMVVVPVKGQLPLVFTSYNLACNYASNNNCMLGVYPSIAQYNKGAAQNHRNFNS